MMENPSRLADLTLVSKYYPVANYSYPRNPSFSRSNRSSFGSSGSAPGLIDDRTDSEASADDEYQYHAHATELWDSFWQSETDDKKPEQVTDPRKHYPALVPSPQWRRRQASQENMRALAWPLSESVAQSRSRKPSATYSPFPKPVALPQPNTRPTPSWTSTRQNGPPQRPPRPDNELLLPCVRESASTVVFKTGVVGPPKSQRPVAIRPQELAASRPVFNQVEWNRPSTYPDTRPVTACDPRAEVVRPDMARMRSHSAFREVVRPPLTTAISNIETEPRSVFDFDDDDEDQGEKPEPESRTRKFFLFHRRIESDRGRMDKTAEQPATRSRANTTPPQIRHRPLKPETPSRKRQMEVWGRILGRRSS
ncbi:hypothetical protein S7711_08781 [Stachybotrys chartarum IBT 7711]|uniref:Uncharacterized protein n=1 Tax=Stachybotrys chartarum (strain CBS 109288 / IBT 7711) TaxID=1280523 RepID=A0A084AIW5_STACB|nr:hypothetical protein S7711_08781 [Stachybotrys chartarum IBT 7711]KFA53977.1 hypothetical protein S40293_01862 [Stachybotrys chartarum IBT 40293]